MINNQELAGGTGVDITISYQVKPWDVPGGATDVNGYYVDGYSYYQGDVPVLFDIDRDLDGTSDTSEQVDLSVEMHTKVSGSAEKYEDKVYYSWNNNWGEKPIDADEYFYIEWHLNEKLSSVTNQPCTVQWNEDTVHDGEFIKYYCNNN